MKPLSFSTVPVLDVLIIDLDELFFYHRTVGVANYLVLRSWMRLQQRVIPKRAYTTRQVLQHMVTSPQSFFSLFSSSLEAKRLRCLLFTGFKLHGFEWLRQGIGFFHVQPPSCDWMIQEWLKTLLAVGIKQQELELSASSKIGNTKKYAQALQWYQALTQAAASRGNALFVLAISEHLMPAIPKQKNFGPVQYSYSLSNHIVFDNHGRIQKAVLHVRNGNDKLQAANAILQDYQKQHVRKNPLRIGLMIDDYDDVALLNLEGISLVLAPKKLRYFIKKSFVRKARKPILVAYL